MDNLNPSDEICLTPEERRELQAAWRDFEAALQPLSEMIRQAEEVNCDDLHSAFLRATDVYDEVERAIMRAKQVRLLHAAHTRHTAD